MLTTRTNRLDPSLFPEEELAELAKLFAKPDQVALIDDQGNRTHIPEALFAHLARIVRLMAERRAIVMMPEDEAFTTQAAANYLAKWGQGTTSKSCRNGGRRSPSLRRTSGSPVEVISADPVRRIQPVVVASSFSRSDRRNAIPPYATANSGPFGSGDIS